ncbi:cadherin-like protein 26 [Paramisgurnus dabryanus]|uniref:cadherin-like protein 26 n=1 Tax=Paramisgurnus dabryanus TaxID=90735 RepID=UPI0031F3A53D
MTLPLTFLLLMFTWTMCAWADTGRIREKRAWIIDSFSIEEEHPGPFPYKLGKIELDRKYLVNFELSGEGVELYPENTLRIDSKTGEIEVLAKVDYEAIDSKKALNLQFQAKNRSNNAVDTRLGVEIKILDVNDHPPMFKPPNYETTVEESRQQDKRILVVLASDGDNSNTPNGTFDFTIKSVTPQTDNVEFYLKQYGDSGTIYFNGCLDYEKAHKYKILVEAKDRGEKVQLSSTSTVTVWIDDKNNHLPEFSGQTGTGRVKERETGTEVLRLQVTDKDSYGTDAWIAKYTIHGDTKNIFQIETDPATNEGVLTVVKPMDYEEQKYQNLSISVHNEAPYFFCKIKKRTPNALGRWELETFFETPNKIDPKSYKSIPVTINVEDVNDPPVFIPPEKSIVVEENLDVGIHLTTMTAKDMDGGHDNTFKFIVGEDPAGWVTIHPETGLISTTKVVDRESEYVNGSTYKVILYAVDNGQPPLTGTGTLFINLIDKNDNVPILTVDHVNICLNKEPAMVNITAVDLDLPPYSSPFSYELLGDVEGKWRLDPTTGTTVWLIKENNAYSGHHMIQMKIADQQGFSNMQNLSVTVCDCSLDSSCHEKMVSTVRIGSSAVWIVVLAILFLIAMLLMALLMTCKDDKKMIIMDDNSSHLLKANTETPGSDCELPIKRHHSTRNSVNSYTQLDGIKKIASNDVQAVPQIPTIFYPDQMFDRSSIYRNSARRSYRSNRNFQRSSFRSTSSYNQMHCSTSGFTEELASRINKSLLAVKAREDEMTFYEPRCYADEGEIIGDTDLEEISIPENDFNPEMLNNLDGKFNGLATICRPDLMKT